MRYTDLSDEQLWKLCCDDNSVAFREIFNRYFKKLKKAVARYIKDQARAEELASDMLVNLWQKRHRIVIAGDFSSYLFKSTRNLVIDELRKKLPLVASIDTLIEHPAMVSEAADYPLMSKEADEFYAERIDELSPQRQRIFQMSRESGMTYEEIAQELGMSVSTVKNYIAASLTILRKTAKEYTLSVIAFVCSICFF